jgi:hypothetical protein
MAAGLRVARADIGLGLYALVFAAFGVSYLTDGTFSDLTSQAIADTFVVAVTAVIAAELVIAARRPRAAATGASAGRVVVEQDVAQAERIVGDRAEPFGLAVVEREVPAADELVAGDALERWLRTRAGGTAA